MTAPTLRFPGKVLGFTGPSGSGKTTLLVKLLPLFRAAGLTVSTVKHTHHTVDLDQPGKDTYEHRMAGAEEVVLASTARFVIQHEYRDAEELPLEALLARMAPVDLVLVEGFRPYPQPKILIHRADSGKPMPDPARLDGLLAIASDVPLDGMPVPVLPLNDPEAVCAFALTALQLGD